MQDFYIIKEDKIYKLGINNEEQELLKVGNLEESVEHYQKRFVKFQKEVDVIVDKINSTDNKGSYLAKMLLFSEQISVHEGIGDYTSLNVKVEEYKNLLLGYVQENRKKNLELKKALFEDLKAIVDEDNWKAISQVKEIHQKWMRIGKANEADEEKVSLKFNALRDRFFEKRKEYVESQKELYEARIDLYKEIIVEIESINNSKDFLKKKSEIEKLVEDWKSNGSVPKTVYDALFKTYKGVLDVYYGKIKPFSKKNTKERFKEMLAEKKTVLEKVENYISSTEKFDIKAVHNFRNEWNAVGTVPGKVLASVGDKYFSAMEFLYEYTNVLRLHEGRKLPIDTESLIKTIKRFIKENHVEITQFEENQAQMTFQLSNQSVTNLIDKRFTELQKKLKAKQRVLAFLENK